MRARSSASVTRQADDAAYPADRGLWRFSCHGAIIFGRPLRCEDCYPERVVLNEESLWYGGPTQRDNPDSAKSIA